MSMNNLSHDGEFRYIVQWFNEWSELQRDDFVPIAVDYVTQTPTPSASASVYVNGVVNSVSNASLKDKPMSLWQCRVKLFREWSPRWPLDFKEKLQQKLSEIDSIVGEKILKEIHAHNGVVPNGNGTVTHDDDTSDEVSAAVMIAATALVEATELAINADSRLSAPVDNEANEANAEVVVDRGETLTAGEPAEPVPLQIEQGQQLLAAEHAVAIVANNAEVPLVA